MNRRQLEKWEQNMPEPIRRMQLQMLMLITAKAFRERPVMLLRLPWERGLETYAECTRRWMERKSNDAGTENDRDRLHKEALRVGKWMRKLFGLKNREDIRLLVVLLYRNIGIELDGPIPGDFFAKQCYFAKGYTPEQCRYMSEMDSGIIEGLFGGGRLYFTERITEGCDSCKACFQVEE